MMHHVFYGCIRILWVQFFYLEIEQAFCEALY